MHRKVLHRDISYHNVYSMPIWAKQPDEMPKIGPRPRFINELLDFEKHENERWES